MQQGHSAAPYLARQTDVETQTLFGPTQNTAMSATTCTKQAMMVSTAQLA